MNSVSCTWPPGCGNTTRNPLGRCHLHQQETASYGVTPFKGVGRVGSDISFADPYYDSPRYNHFETALYREGDRHGVELDETERALGLWEGSNEPSTAVTAHGTREGIEATARAIGRQFNQYAVRVIYRPGNGAHKQYTFQLRGDLAPQEVIGALGEAGISGARVTETELQLADATDLQPHQLRALERFFGAADIQPCEVVRVFQQ